MRAGIRVVKLAKGERGAITYLTAILLPVIIGMGALVMDQAFGRADRRDLQNCVDSAALAGARELPNELDDPEGNVARGVAEDYLYDFGEEDYQGPGHCLRAEDPEPSINLSDDNENGSLDTVEVVATRVAPFGLGRAIGFASGTVGVRAVARLTQPESFTGMEPFGIQVDQDVIPDDCGQPFSYYTINGEAIVQGEEMAIKLIDSEVPSHYNRLALGGPGTNTYRENIENGYDGWVATCQYVPEQTGNSPTPTYQGLENRGLLEEQWCGADWGPPGYRWQDCPWIMLIAFVPPDPPGQQDVAILTFAYFEVTGFDKNKSDLMGIFIDTENRYVPGGEFEGEEACDPALGLPCGVKLIE